MNINVTKTGMDVFRRGQQIGDAVTQAVAEVVRDEDFASSVATFSSEPTFRITGSGDRREVSTSDVAYRDLNFGTDTRDVVMTPGFVSKTVPNVLAARGGSGRVAGPAKRPMPGIEARNFDLAVEKKRSGAAAVRVAQAALDRIFN